MNIPQGACLRAITVKGSKVFANLRMKLSHSYLEIEIYFRDFHLNSQHIIELYHLKGSLSFLFGLFNCHKKHYLL